MCVVHLKSLKVAGAKKSLLVNLISYPLLCWLQDTWEVIDRDITLTLWNFISGAKLHGVYGHGFGSAKKLAW
jgi:hypothetical protein